MSLRKGNSARGNVNNTPVGSTDAPTEEVKVNPKTKTAYGSDAMSRTMASGRRPRLTNDRTKGDVFLGRAMHSTATSGISHPTEAFFRKMEDVVKKLNANLERPDYVKIAALGTSGANLRFDVVTLGRTYIQPNGANTLALYIFVIAASRGELAPLNFDVGNAGRVQLPNVCGDVPDDRFSTIEQIHTAVTANSLSLFKVESNTVFIVGERVIERDNLLSTIEGDDAQYIQLLKEAVDTMDTYDSLFNDAAEQIDWANVATGEGGRAVTNSVDFNPTDLFTATGHPVHRQFSFRTSAYADDGDSTMSNRAPLEVQEIGTLSAYFDVSVADYDKDDRDAEPPAFLSCIVTDWRTDLGRNYLQLFMINLANLTQIREDYQYLPAFDYRKREPHSDISVLGCEVPAVFGLKDPSRLVINDPTALLDVAQRAIQDTMEFAYDSGNCQAQSGLTQVIQDAANNPGGAGYWAIIDAIDEVTGNIFSQLFFEGTSENATPPLFFSDNNLQLGGWRIDSNATGLNKRRDFRDINHLAIVDANPHDQRIGATYDDTIVPESEMAIAQRLNSSLLLKEAVATRLTVTQYIRRYTFDPDMILALAESMDRAGFLATIDGGRHQSDVRRRSVEDFRQRGVPSTRRSKRRAPARRRDY